MGSFAFPITFFFGFIPLGLFQSMFDLGIRVQTFGSRPFLHSSIHFICAVISPARKFCDIGRTRRGIGCEMACMFERLESGGELALAQIKSRQVQQQAKIVRSERKSLPIVIDRRVRVTLAD